jgi:ABC-type spermidine/putrescine transport system permease subunit II
VTAVAPALSRSHTVRKIKNNVATVMVTLAFLIALIPLVWLLWTVVSKGWHALTRDGWFTSDVGTRTYRDPGGGALHAIIGTAEQVLLCSLISVPIAVMVGIYLVEYGRGPLARTTTFMVDILSGVPSIVAALFIYAVFVTTLGGQRGGWLVSLALVLLMIPVIVRTTEEMLKLVPNELREASYALGVPKWKTIARIVVPTALTGIINRHRARHRSRGRRDSAAADPGRLHRQHEHQPVRQGLPGIPAGHDQRAGRQPRREPLVHRAADPQLRCRPDVGRGAHTHHHRHGPEPDRSVARALQQDQPVGGIRQWPSASMRTT